MSVRNSRRKMNLGLLEFAKIFNVPGYIVSRWEEGVTRPTGANYFLATLLATALKSEEPEVVKENLIKHKGCLFKTFKYLMAIKRTKEKAQKK